MNQTSQTLTDQTPSSRDEELIRQLVINKGDAMKATDVETLTGTYLPEVVKFGLAPPLQRTGPDAYDPTTLRSWFATFDGPVDYEIRDLVITAGDEVAFCSSLNRLSATPRGSSDQFDLWFRATIGLRKVDGAWRIVHEHESTPFYMDGSFKAALDLEPSK
jgi:ketosteroid isomerase-like protein